jgi:hypothetical protein
VVLRCAQVDESGSVTGSARHAEIGRQRQYAPAIPGPDRRHADRRRP